MNQVLEMVAHGLPVRKTEPFGKFHWQDIRDMEAAGYPVTIKGDFIEVNVFVFKGLDRDQDFKVTATGKDGEQNCKAYPIEGSGLGGWDISLYGKTAEQMKDAGCPGWKNNRNGFARRIYPGHEVQVDLTKDTESEVIEKSLRGLSHREGVFARGNQLARVVFGAPRPHHAFTDPAHPTIETIPKAVLASEIEAGCKFVRSTGRGRPGKKSKAKPARALVPERIVKAVHEYANYPPCIRPLTMVVTTPRFIPNGDILATHGYHAETGIYYAPDKLYRFGGPMSVRDAKACLEDVLQDFPFQLPIHKSVFYSGLLSLLARPAYTGCVPMHLFDANQPGSGKGLLVDVLATIGLGYTLPRMTMSESGELKKVLTSCVFAGDCAILLDNLTGTLKSEHLDALLTSTVWKDRVLGVSQMRTVNWHGVIFATANNLRVPRDTYRRLAYARLQSPLANPELRDDVKIKRLLDYCKGYRNDLSTAALSLLYQWHRAKRPKQNLTEWGSYEAWSDVVRQCMAWCDLGDPLQTHETFRDSDFETNLLAQLLDAWQELEADHKNVHGLTAAFACEQYQAGDLQGPKYPRLRELLDELPGRDPRTELGKLLAQYRDRVHDGRCLVRSEGARARWKVKVLAGDQS